MINLIYKEQEHGQDDYQKETCAAGHKVHNLAHIRQFAFVNSHNITVGNNVSIRNALIVVAYCGVIPCAVLVVYALYAVGVKDIFAVDYGVETDNIPPPVILPGRIV